jgi:glutamine amidotransferase
MQILAGSSDEGTLPGLNWIPGKVRAFRSHPLAINLPMPHMGWNDVKTRRDCRLFEELTELPRFYFLHSFYFDCEDSGCVAAEADYGFPFHCAIQSGNVFGVQFHPEKSHHWGTQLLKNFSEI